MSDLIVREFGGRKIRQRADGFLSLTDMGKAGGKLFADWNRLKAAQEFLKTLIDSRYGESHNGPIEINQGGVPELQGTWGDRIVALEFARWISPAFAIQCNEWIEELLTKGTVSIAPQPEPVRALAPQRDLLDYLEAAKSIGIDQDPILKSLFSQRMAEQLGEVPQSKNLPVVLTVRAQQLGYSQKDIGSGTKLGAYVSKRVSPLPGKSQHGKYAVNAYALSSELDAAIHAYFGNASGALEAA